MSEQENKKVEDALRSDSPVSDGTCERCGDTAPTTGFFMILLCGKCEARLCDAPARRYRDELREAIEADREEGIEVEVEHNDGIVDYFPREEPEPGDYTLIKREGRVQ